MSEESNVVPEGAEALTRFLSALVVPDSVTIEDVAGTSYSFRPVLPARRQIEASLVLERMVQRGIRLRGAVEAGGGGGVAAVAAFLSELATDADAEAEVERLFRVCHPEIAEQLGAVPVFDRFEIDQIVAALLPFFARFATRTARVLGVKLTPLANG